MTGFCDYGSGARLLHRYVRYRPGFCSMALGAKATQQAHGSEGWQWRISDSHFGRVCWEASLGGFPNGACQRRKSRRIGRLIHFRCRLLADYMDRPRCSRPRRLPREKEAVRTECTAAARALCLLLLAADIGADFPKCARDDLRHWASAVISLCITIIRAFSRTKRPSLLVLSAESLLT
jgi:hypothetical protein